MAESSVRSRRGRRISRAVLVVCVFASGGFSFALETLRQPSIEQMVKMSDAIFVAVVEQKDSQMRHGNILTTYQIRPLEFWKGNIATDAKGVFPMEQVGGSFRNGEIAIGQHVTGTTPMVPGEEVLLFTRTYNPNPAIAGSSAPSAITAGTPALVNPMKGRYSILTDPATGTKHVLGHGSDWGGVIPNDLAVTRKLNAKQRELKQPRRAGEKSAEEFANPGAREIRDFDDLNGVRTKVAEAMKAAGS